jgi:hypothetical protein
MLEDFQSINEQTGYTYRRSPLHDRTFNILRRNEEDGAYLPVGDYTVLDAGENPHISERKVINLITLLNGGDRVIQLGEETHSRLLYHVVPHDGPREQTRILFYTLGDKGVSKENAVLSINERVKQ